MFQVPLNAFENEFLDFFLALPLRKQAYSNIENLQTKKEKFESFHISDQNIDCGYSLEPPRRGGSNECPQSTFF